MGRPGPGLDIGFWPEGPTRPGPMPTPVKERARQCRSGRATLLESTLVRNFREFPQLLIPSRFSASPPGSILFLVHLAFLFYLLGSAMAWTVAVPLGDLCFQKRLAPHQVSSIRRLSSRRTSTMKTSDNVLVPVIQNDISTSTEESPQVDTDDVPQVDTDDVPQVQTEKVQVIEENMEQSTKNDAAWKTERRSIPPCSNGSLAFLQSKVQQYGIENQKVVISKFSDDSGSGNRELFRELCRK